MSFFEQQLKIYDSESSDVRDNAYKLGNEFTQPSFYDGKTPITINL